MFLVKIIFLTKYSIIMYYPKIKIVLAAFVLFTLSNTSTIQSQNSVAIDTKTASKTMEWMDCPPFMPEGCAVTVLNGDPSKGNFDILYKVPANVTIAKHWHTSAERMILLTGEMTVTYDGEKPTVLKPGTYAYGPAKKPHIAKCGDKGPCTLFIAFEEPMDAIEVKN